MQIANKMGFQKKFDFCTIGGVSTNNIEHIHFQGRVDKKTK
jgi:hypothetical protein